MRKLILLASGLLISGSLFANAAQPAAMQQDMQQPAAATQPAMQGNATVTPPAPPADFCKDPKNMNMPLCQQQPAAMPAAEAQPAAMPANTMQPAAMPAKQGY